MANEGYLDDVEKGNVKKVEEELYNTLDSEFTEFTKSIDQGEFNDEIKAKMKEICERTLKKI